MVCGAVHAVSVSNSVDFDARIPPDTEAEILSFYMRYCPLGHMESREFMKMMKDASLISAGFSSGEAELVFQKSKVIAASNPATASSSHKGMAGHGHHKIPNEAFRNISIPLIAKKKGITVEYTIHLLIAAGGSSFIRLTMPDAARFHDERSTYTGTHACGGPSFAEDPTCRLDKILDRSEADVRGAKKYMR